MKPLWILLLLVNPLVGKAQTAAEWTRQKATQRKYLYGQLAALKVYADRLQEGYTIVQKGLVTVRDIRNGEWRLHEDFFEGLDRVSPPVKDHPTVAAVLSLQKHLLKETGALRSWLQQAALLTRQEKLVVERVCDNLLVKSARDLEELLAVITSGTYQMNDAARLQRLETLLAQVQETGVFLESFRRTVAALASGRKGDVRDSYLSKQINGLP